ncbi:MAG: FeoB-associated Cys-rich membrane protein [Clostridia bacterium]|nr:FeoB-associated Cys-rich membrane protein [Clostridia bacterium]
MFEWIGKNIGTIIVLAVLAAIVALIIVKLIADKKKGKSASCGCGCEACAMHDACRHSHD